MTSEEKAIITCKTGLESNSKEDSTRFDIRPLNNLSMKIVEPSFWS